MTEIERFYTYRRVGGGCGLLLVGVGLVAALVILVCLVGG